MESWVKGQSAAQRTATAAMLPWEAPVVTEAYQSVRHEGVKRPEALLGAGGDPAVITASSAGHSGNLQCILDSVTARGVEPQVSYCQKSGDPSVLIHLPIHPSPTHLSTHPSTHPQIHPPTYASGCPPICRLPTYLPIPLHPY